MRLFGQGWTLLFGPDDAGASGGGEAAPSVTPTNPAAPATPASSAPANKDLGFDSGSAGEAMAQKFFNDQQAEESGKTPETTGETVADQGNDSPAEFNDEPAKPAVAPAVAQPAQGGTDYKAVVEGYAQLVSQYQARMAEMEQRFNAQQAPVVPAPTEAAFDLEAWQKSVDADPAKAIGVAAEHYMGPKLKALQGEIDQYKAHVQQQEQVRAEENFRLRIENQQKAVEQKYPDFKPGSPIYKATYAWCAENAQWLKQVAMTNPNFNPVDHAYTQVAYPILAQKLKAQEGKLIDKRAQAVSVKPGSTASVPTPANGNPAQQAAAKLAQKGEPVPQWMVDLMSRSVEKYS